MRAPVAKQEENPATVAVTVGWMLTICSAALAEALAGGAYLVVRTWPAAVGQEHPLAFLPGLMLLIALVTGLASLALTPVVYRVHRDALPPLITALAMVVGLIPLVTITVLLLRR